MDKMDGKFPDWLRLAVAQRFMKVKRGLPVGKVLKAKAKVKAYPVLAKFAQYLIILLESCISSGV